MKKTTAVPTEKTRIITDPATKAQRLFKWNEKDGTWESDDGTILDDSRLKDWEKQRKSDRKWADDQMDKLKNRNTDFDREMDKMKEKERKELEEMDKFNEKRNRFSKRTGRYEMTEEEMKKYLDDESRKAELERDEQLEWDAELESKQNRVEWIQWGADLGIDICDILSFGTLHQIKNMYIAGRDAGSELIDGLLKKRSLGTILTRTGTKIGINITQSNVEKTGLKYATNGIGDGIKEVMDAEDGQSKTKAFFRGTLKGTARTGIEHGLSKVKFPKTAKTEKISKDAVAKSSKILGFQQSGDLSMKTGNALRSTIRTNAAQEIGREINKNKGLTSTGLGSLSDGIINYLMGEK